MVAVDTLQILHSELYVAGRERIWHGDNQLSLMVRPAFSYCSQEADWIVYMFDDLAKQHNIPRACCNRGWDLSGNVGHEHIRNTQIRYERHRLGIDVDSGERLSPLREPVVEPPAGSTLLRDEFQMIGKTNVNNSLSRNPAPEHIKTSLLSRLPGAQAQAV